MFRFGVGRMLSTSYGFNAVPEHLSTRTYYAVQYCFRVYMVRSLEILSHDAMHSADCAVARCLSSRAVWHYAMWRVAVGWHGIEFAQTSAILEFYFRFRFQLYLLSRHFILHQFAKAYPKRTAHGRKKWRHVDFKYGGTPSSWIEVLEKVFLKSPCIYDFL